MGTATDEWEQQLQAARAAREEAGTFDDGPQNVYDGDELADGNGQFVLRIGGHEPTTNAVRLYGGAIEIEPPEDGFVKGASYVLRVECVCHKVSLVDERDGKTGDIVGCRDERGLKITGASLA